MSRALSIACMVAAALSISSPTHAAFIDGNRLFSDCKLAEEQGPLKWQSAGICSAYIIGVVDSLGSEYLCLPETAILGQIRDVAFLYLKKHPEKRAMAASFLVALSLKEAFCE